MRVIIVGAGGTGRELLRRLGSTWDVVLVDTDEARLELAADLRQFERVVSDGSSAVVLDRAGLEGAAAVVAASPDDDANLEVVRIAKAAGVVRVIGVAGDPERVQDYKTLDVPVFSPNGLAARNVELELEPRRVASSAFAGGKAEAVEVYIAPDASVAGKRLKDLHAHSWVVAAVLRGSDLIVPHGDTRLEAGDRVTVVGAAADYQAIVAAFTSGVSRFPLAFGRKVVVRVTPGEMVDGLVEEAARLVRDSRADVLTVVVRSAEDRDDPDTNESIREVVTDIADGIDVDFRATDGPIPDAIVQLVREENVGVVVVPGTDPGTRFARFGIAKLLNT